MDVSCIPLTHSSPPYFTTKTTTTPPVRLPPSQTFIPSGTRTTYQQGIDIEVYTSLAKPIDSQTNRSHIVFIRVCKSQFSQLLVITQQLKGVVCAHPTYSFQFSSVIQIPSLIPRLHHSLRHPVHIHLVSFSIGHH